MSPFLTITSVGASIILNGKYAYGLESGRLLFNDAGYEDIGWSVDILHNLTISTHHLGLLAMARLAAGCGVFYLFCGSCIRFDRVDIPLGVDFGQFTRVDCKGIPEFVCLEILKDVK